MAASGRTLPNVTACSNVCGVEVSDGLRLSFPAGGYGRQPKVPTAEYGQLSGSLIFGLCCLGHMEINLRVRVTATAPADWRQNPDLEIL